MKGSEIAKMNPWWGHGKEFSLYDHDMKKLGEVPARFDREFPDLRNGRIVVLLGPRQVGKTSLVKQMIGKLVDQGLDPRAIVYLSLDRLGGINEFKEALGQRRNPSHVFLDEASRLKGTMEVVKTLADGGDLTSTSLLLTGSSPAEILRASELAPGRGAEGNVYYLRPLSFRDFLMCQHFSVGHGLGTLGFQDEEIALARQMRSRLQNVSIDLDSDGQDAIYEKADLMLPFIQVIDLFFQVYLETGGFPLAINRYLWHRERPAAEQGSNPAEIFVRDIFGDLSDTGKSEVTLRRPWALTRNDPLM